MIKHPTPPVLRYRLNVKFQQWKASGQIQSLLVNPFPHASSSHMAFIFGYKTKDDMERDWTDKSSHLVDQMLGPNGFVVYKLLLIQAIDREENKHVE